MDDVQIQVRFTIHDPDTGQDFSDALYFPSWENYQSISSVDLDAMKQLRFNTWKAALNAPQPVVTPEEQQSATVTQIADLLSQGNTLIATLPPDVALPIAQGVADQANTTIGELTQQVDS